ncbi:hypothetical protein LguiA_033252 [Lonicera macranthoides]
MSRRVKEEERIERIIHGLLKLPENRRCINCNSLGPQYVCTTFWTFICSTCSGVHRGFTHRVKSVSAAKFNAEEVDSLQAGGNERAKEIYFKLWDPCHNSYPDGRNIQRLQEFIKHVYVDRRYTGVKNTDNLAMVKVVRFEQVTSSNRSFQIRPSTMGSINGGKDDYYDRYSYEKYIQDSKDDYYGRPNFEKLNPSGKNEVRTLKYYIEERSPRQKPENAVRTSSQRSRRAFFEIVDDRIRDGHGSGRRSGRFSNVEVGNKSDDPQKGRGTVSPPAVRPLKEILGENIPPLTVGKVLMDNHGKDANAGAGADVDAQKTESSSSPKAVKEKAAESKTATRSSLIDFSMEPEVSDTAAVQEIQQIVPYVDAGNSAESSTMNTSKPQNVNSVESLLFELSALAIVPASTTSEAPNASDASSPALPIVLSNEVGATITGSTTNTPSVPSNEILALPSSTGEYNTTKANEGQQLVTMQHYQPSVSAAGDSGSNGQQSISLYNQPWIPSPAPNAQEPPLPNASADRSSEATNSGDVAKSIGRKELPVDLFMLGYSSYTAPVPSWQFRPSYGLGYNIQYHPNAMPISAFPNSARSRNPFDLGNDTPQIQGPMFPSQPQPSPYPTAMPPHLAPYGMAMPPGAYTGQQQPNDMPVSRPQRTSSTGSADAAFASLNPVHKSSSAYTSPNGPNSFSSMGGNPFG